MLTYIDESAGIDPLLDFSKPVPNEILNKIFLHCTADDLDNCKKVRRQWYHIIEDAGNRLPQREIAIKLDESGIIDVLEVNAVESGKKIRVDIEKIREESPFNVFKGCIVPRMDEKLNLQHTLQSRLKRMFELGGGKIPVETFGIALAMRDFGEVLAKLRGYFRRKLFFYFYYYLLFRIC